MTSSAEEMIAKIPGRPMLEPGQTVPAEELLALLDVVEFACLKLPMTDPITGLLEAAARRAIFALNI